MGLLQIRERPPLALCLSVQPPAGGPAFRWGSDDPRVENVPDGLSFTTTIPGGFAALNATLQRDRRLFYPDEKEFATITALGLGGRTVAWQGRLVQFPDVQGFQAQVNPQASGWQAHLDDDDSAAIIFVDQGLTEWGSPSPQRQIDLLNGTFGTVFPPSGQSAVATSPTNTPALQTTLTEPWNANARIEAWYDSGLSGGIGSIYFAFITDGTVNVTDPNWAWTVSATPSDDGGSGFTSSNLRAASGAAYYTPTSPERFAFLSQYYAAAVSGAAPQSLFWQKLAVYGPHGLTLHGPDPGGLLASDMIAYTLSRWCPKLAFTTGSTGTIQPSSFIIPQAAFKTSGTSSPIIKRLAGYELLDWAVWELGRGPAAVPAFYLNAFNGRGRTWRARVGPSQLQNNGPNVSRIWNGVIVQFNQVDGTTGTAGPPGSGAMYTDASLLDTDSQNPANQVTTASGQVLRRWAPLQMGTTTPAAAIQVGARFLQAQKQLDTSGQAALVGHVQDGSGVWWPAWMVRAGDSIAFVDAGGSGTSPRRIVSTSYDHSSKTNTIQLDQPPDSLSALFERLSVVIQPAGFS